MTRLEQALRWWGHPNRNGDPIPSRHYAALDSADYFGEPHDDEVDLNAAGDAAMKTLGYRRRPECLVQWVQLDAKEGQSND